jgi:sugar phosphate permease
VNWIVGIDGRRYGVQIAGDVCLGRPRGTRAVETIIIIIIIIIISCARWQVTNHRAVVDTVCLCVCLAGIAQ